MGANDLINILREHKVAYLGTCVYVVNGLESVSVPEADATICSTTT